MTFKRKPPFIYQSKTLLTNLFVDLHVNKHSYNDNEADPRAFDNHVKMAKRIKKTFYYGQLPKTERLSLPLSELVVEIFSEVVPDGLGRIDLDYTASLSRNACVSPCAMILALAYIERLRHRSPEYLLQVSSSDLFLVSMMIASKFLYDAGESEEVFNDEWAVSASIDIKDVNQLEMDFLRAIDWNVYVDQSTFIYYMHWVEFILAIRKSKERGWCTYTELDVIIKSIAMAEYWRLLTDYVAKVIAVSSLAYSASILAMVGATIATAHIHARFGGMGINNLPAKLNDEVGHFQTDLCSLPTNATSVNMTNGSDLFLNSFWTGIVATPLQSLPRHVHCLATAMTPPIHCDDLPHSCCRVVKQVLDGCVESSLFGIRAPPNRKSNRFLDMEKSFIKNLNHKRKWLPVAIR